MKTLLSALFVSAGLMVAGVAQAATPSYAATGTQFTPAAATQKAKPAKKAKKKKAKKVKQTAAQ
jgi:hypothetical protein